MAVRGRPKKGETTKFILLMDRLFDYLNVRALEVGEHKRKPDLMSFRSAKDPRVKVTVYLLAT